MSFEKHSTSDVDQNNIVQGARQRAPSFKTVGSPGEEGFTAEKQLEGRHKGGAKDDAKAGGKLKSDEVVRPDRRIGRVGADDDGNLCVVRRSE
jgi:hypothetical protein